MMTFQILFMIWQEWDEKNEGLCTIVALMEPQLCSYVVLAK